VVYFFLPQKIEVDPISDPNARMHVYLRNTYIKQATRKRLGMHVLLIDVEERNSEKKIIMIPHPNVAS
jgi:hypothetical protein